MNSPMVVTSGDTRDIQRFATKYANGKANSSTITKRFENKYATGTVNISPGSVSVTSIAKSRQDPEFDTYRPMSLVAFKPIIPNLFIHRPFPMLEPKYYYPWFPNNVFKNTAPSNADAMTPPWFQPQLYPFLHHWP